MYFFFYSFETRLSRQIKDRKRNSYVPLVITFLPFKMTTRPRTYGNDHGLFQWKTSFEMKLLSFHFQDEKASGDVFCQETRSWDEIQFSLQTTVRDRRLPNNFWTSLGVVPHPFDDAPALDQLDLPSYFYVADVSHVTCRLLLLFSCCLGCFSGFFILSCRSWCHAAAVKHSIWVHKTAKRIKEIEEEELYFYSFWCLSHSCFLRERVRPSIFSSCTLSWHGDVMVLMYSWSRVEWIRDITFSCLLHFFQDNNIISTSERKVSMGDPTGNRHLLMTKESKKQ